MKKRKIIIGLFLIVLVSMLNMFFIKTNYVWALYLIPVFCLFTIAAITENSKSFAFSVIGYLFLVMSHLAINLLVVKGHPFVVYLAFAFAWWPLYISYRQNRNKLRFSLYGYAIFTVFLMACNWITTPDIFWAYIPILALSIWPMSFLFMDVVKKNKRRKYAKG